MDLVWWALVALVAVVVVSLVALYSRLRRLRRGAEDAQAQMDTQLGHRHDLVPKIIAIVERHSSHETVVAAVRNAHTAVVEAAGAQEQAAAEDALTSELGRLLAAAEATPSLQANDDFLALNRELAETEGRIEFARRYYEERVGGYDSALAGWPSSLVAAAFGFRPKPSGL
jgi:LemA protein